MSERLRGVVFACLLAFIGFHVFASSYTGALADYKDWGFHKCYAETLDAYACSNGGYTYYAPLGHLPAFALSFVGVPVEITISLILAVCVSLLAWWLFKRSGLTGVTLFFLVTPALIVFVLRRTPFLWLTWGLCGNYAWVLALTLFAWLAFNWNDLPPSRRILGVIPLIFVHNYGWGLVALLLAGTFLWNAAYFLYGQEHDLFLFFGFLIALFIFSGILPLASVRLVSLALLCISVVIADYGLDFKEQFFGCSKPSS